MGNKMVNPCCILIKMSLIQSLTFCWKNHDKIHCQTVFQIRFTHHSLSDADDLLYSILDLLV